MYLSRGLYVFPNKNTIRRFMYDGEEATELPEIGPQQIYKFRLQHSELLADYDRAINRNYRRVERYELKLGDEKQGKDLSYNDYADWLRDLHNAKVSFMSGEMSAEEFMKVVHRLD